MKYTINNTINNTVYSIVYKASNLIISRKELTTEAAINRYARAQKLSIPYSNSTKATTHTAIDYTSKLDNTNDNRNVSGICENTNTERSIFNVSSIDNELKIIKLPESINQVKLPELFKVKTIDRTVHATIKLASGKLHTEKFYLHPDAYPNPYRNYDIANLECVVERFGTTKYDTHLGDNGQWYWKKELEYPKFGHAILRKFKLLHTQVTLLEVTANQLHTKLCEIMQIDPDLDGCMTQYATKEERLELETWKTFEYRRLRIVYMMNRPKRYVITAPTLTKEVVNRVQQLVKYGNSPWLWIENNSSLQGIQIKSYVNQKTSLEQHMANEQDPKLERVRVYHEYATWTHVQHITRFLWEWLWNAPAEFHFENSIDTQFNVNNHVEDWSNYKQIEKLSLTLQPYGLGVKYWETPTSIDDYSDARDTFSKKPVAFAETSNTMWDYEGRIEKATIKLRQKNKVNKLPVSKTEIYTALDMWDWYAKHYETTGEDLVADPEFTKRCDCGYHVSIQDTHCEICGIENPHYEPMSITRESEEFNNRLMEMNEQLKSTLKIYSIK